MPSIWALAETEAAEPCPANGASLEESRLPREEHRRYDLERTDGKVRHVCHVARRQLTDGRKRHRLGKPARARLTCWPQWT